MRCVPLSIHTVEVDLLSLLQTLTFFFVRRGPQTSNFFGNIILQVVVTLSIYTISIFTLWWSFFYLFNVKGCCTYLEFLNYRLFLRSVVLHLPYTRVHNSTILIFLLGPSLILFVTNGYPLFFTNTNPFPYTL